MKTLKHLAAQWGPGLLDKNPRCHPTHVKANRAVCFVSFVYRHLAVSLPSACFAAKVCTVTDSLF